MIMSTRSFVHLREVFSKYSEMFDNDIKKVIKSSFSGDLQVMLLAIADCAENIPAFQAEVLYRATKGAGTDDNTLIRVIATRSETDLEQIKIEFGKKYERKNIFFQIVKMLANFSKHT